MQVEERQQVEQANWLRLGHPAVALAHFPRCYQRIALLPHFERRHPHVVLFPLFNRRHPQLALSLLEARQQVEEHPQERLLPAARP